jgi:hypothetical protein
MRGRGEVELKGLKSMKGMKSMTEKKRKYETSDERYEDWRVWQRNKREYETVWNYTGIWKMWRIWQRKERDHETTYERNEEYNRERKAEN